MLDAYTPYAISSSASQASTVTTNAFSVGSDDLEDLVIIQNVGVITGSITGKIQDSADGSTGWADFGTPFAAVSSAYNNQTMRINPTATRGWIRYVGTIVTGPANLAVLALGLKKQGA